MKGPFFHLTLQLDSTSESFITNTPTTVLLLFYFFGQKKHTYNNMYPTSSSAQHHGRSFSLCTKGTQLRQEIVVEFCRPNCDFFPLRGTIE